MMYEGGEMARNIDRAVSAALAGRDQLGNVVDPGTGNAVRMSEARRVQLALSAVKAEAAHPDGVSDVIPIAPARGPADAWRDTEAYMTDSGPRIRRAPIPAGSPLRVCLPLERLEAASRRRRKDGPLFTVAQHQAAAEYEALFIRVHGGRVKCSDLDGGRGGGNAAGVMDAVINDIQRLRRMDRAIGHEPVLSPRGVTAHPGRVTIRADVLVYWVLSRAEPLEGLLQRHGWSVQSRYRRKLLDALGAAMDRLHGL